MVTYTETSAVPRLTLIDTYLNYLVSFDIYAITFVYLLEMY
jgi:hypothetical protein